MDSRTRNEGKNTFAIFHIRYLQLQYKKYGINVKMKFCNNSLKYGGLEKWMEFSIALS